MVAHGSAARRSLRRRSAATSQCARLPGNNTEHQTRTTDHGFRQRPQPNESLTEQAPSGSGQTGAAKRLGKARTAREQLRTARHRIDPAADQRRRLRIDDILLATDGMRP